MQLAEQLQKYEEQLGKTYATKNKPYFDKSKSQRHHARTRALERYNIKLTRTEMDEIIELLAANRDTCVERQSNRVTIHVIEYQGKKMRVVYDKKRGNLVSFLPLEPKAEVRI